MRADLLELQLADELQHRSGWRRHDLRPHCFVHSETGLQIVVFADSLSITLGHDEQDTHDRGVSVRTALYPKTGLEIVLEVADALVFHRTDSQRRARVRKGGRGMVAGDVVLLLLAQHGGLNIEDLMARPEWTQLAGWPRNPSISTMMRAVADLRAAGLVEATDEPPAPSGRRNLLTRDGWPVAARIAGRMGIPLPDPVT